MKDRINTFSLTSSIEMTSMILRFAKIDWSINQMHQCFLKGCNEWEIRINKSDL